jgi:hypothetical protein
MTPFEFTTDLTPEAVPPEIADQLPKSGRARVIVVPMPSTNDERDAEWRAGAYEQFLRDDSPEDAVYDD